MCNKWTSVNERIPPVNSDDTYLVTVRMLRGYTVVELADWINGQWAYGPEFGAILAWMPLPKKYENAS